MRERTEQQFTLTGVGAPGLVAVEGAISRVRFQNPENGFAIVTLDCNGVSEVVKGSLGRVAVGDSLRIEGIRKRDPKWGEQIEATKVIPIAPETADGVARYLAELPGLGDVLARRLVEAFGNKAIEVLCNEPERVARTVQGVTVKKAEAASEAARERREEQEVLVWLYGIGLSPAFATRVLREWGGQAPGIIRANPYRLAREIDRIGFALADSIARNLGIPEDAIERREAAILHVLGEAASSGARYKDPGGKERSTGGGHCYLPRVVLADITAQLLTLSRAAVEEAIGTLVEQEAIVVEEEQVYSRQLFRAEHGVAERIATLLRTRREAPPAPAAGTPAAAELVKLSDEQRAGADLTRSSAVVVITGGPGTGKTTLMKAVVALWTQAKRTVLLCAPTGRAAKRLAESTGKGASTIHRLLEWEGETGAFKRNAESPLSCDLVVVDESSMLDTPLARSLLAAIPQGASLLLVGDVDQLPSVGAGQVLHDVIESGQVPVARLSRIFRQREGSEISEAAASILRGEVPRSGGGELSIVPVWTPEADGVEPPGAIAQREIVHLVTEVLPRQGFSSSHVQVLTPMHKGQAGTQALNKALQAALNPNGAELRRGGEQPPFRVGDPVLQTRNDYDLNCMNGDLGRVVAVDPEVPSVTSDFYGTEVTHAKEAIGDLELAYAMSVHKSQGGEYPCVVMVLLMEHFMMLRRNLLYTGVTRGKKRVVIVGAHKALGIAVRTRDTSTRYTGLRDRIRKAIETSRKFAASAAVPVPRAFTPPAVPAALPSPVEQARRQLEALTGKAPPPRTPAFVPPGAEPPAPGEVGQRIIRKLREDHAHRRAMAARAMQILAGRCDGAQARDGSGFNAHDTERGHELADIADSDRSFSDEELGEATRLARRYHRQLPADVLTALRIESTS